MELIPNVLIKELLDLFRATKKDGGALGTEACTGRILNAFLGYISVSTVSFPGLSQLIFLVINWYVVVHLIHSFFYVLVNV